MTKPRTSIKSRAKTAELLAIADWLTMEARKGCSEAPSADLAFIGRYWPEAEVSGDAILLRIHDSHGPRIFDPAVAVFLRLCTTFSGSISLNPVGGTDEKKKLYPVLVTYSGKDPVTRQSRKQHFSIDRLVVDANEGKQIREISKDYRDRRRSNLVVGELSHDRPSKYRLGRQEDTSKNLRFYGRVARR